MDPINASTVTTELRVKSDEGEISTLDLLIVLAHNKRTLLLWPILAGVVAIVVSFLLPVTYQASTRILPPQQQQSAASMLASQLGQFAGLAGGVGGMLKNPNDLYVAMLKSNSIADKMIERFRLKEHYDVRFQTDARKALLANTTLNSGKDGLMVIDVVDRDPKQAADIANGYVEELVALTKRLAITEAQQRRVFFEKQLAQAKEQLTNAEGALKSFQETTGLIKLDEQAKGLVEGGARLRAQIAAKEVEASVMRSYATDQNPQLKIVQEELAGMRKQLQRLESHGATASTDGGDRFLASKKIPGAGLDYIRLLRNVKYYETIFELMAKQFEAARIDESREGTIVQVVDNAQVPEQRFSPQRAPIIVSSVLAALLLTALWLLVRHVFANIWTSPAHDKRLHELKAALAWRSKAS